MSELLIELFSEEMPPNLQINARTQFKKFLQEEISSLNLKPKKLSTLNHQMTLLIFLYLKAYLR